MGIKVRVRINGVGEVRTIPTYITYTEEYRTDTVHLIRILLRIRNRRIA